MWKGLPGEKDEYLALIRRLPPYARLVKNLLSETGLTRGQRMILGSGIAYLLSPIDFIPGVVPVLGQLDDILVVLLCVRRAVKNLNQEKLQVLLSEQDITLEQIDADIALIKTTMAAIARKAGSLVVAGLSRAGKAAIGRIKPLRPGNTA